MKNSVAVSESLKSAPVYANREASDVLFTLSQGSVKLRGYIDNAIRFIEDYQLIDPPQWKRFVDQFRATEPKADDNDVGWRGEYWGKMMRGACFTYAYTQNPELYGTLCETVRDMMTAQDDLGRISSYSVAAQYRGWDIWARKYVLLGMQYFIEICKDESFVAEIIECMKKQVDYMISTIGDEREGKLRLTLCTSHWRGLNSSSLLEPIVRLYNITGEKRYLDFATYIVSLGGTEGQNIYELAAEGKLYPYQYNVTKAYEMMSCFEGLLEYYRVTGLEKWKIAVVNLANLIADSDISVIGSAGCTHELFDHSSIRQLTTEYFGVMQETCVTVTWMKFCYQVLCISGDSRMADEIERSIYNGMLGAINYDKHSGNGGFPFDSYSPLLFNTRLTGVGGKKIMADGTAYGCCACIGSAGTGIIPKYAVMLRRDGIAINLYCAGGFNAKTPCGKDVGYEIETKYPADGRVSVKICSEADEEYTVALRIPYWSACTTVKLNGEEISASAGSYCEITRLWAMGDEIALEFDMRCAIVLPEDSEYSDKNSKYHVALRRGPLMLARDARLPGDIESIVDFSKYEKDGYVPCVPATADFDHFYCFDVTQSDGSTVRMVDYPSAGRTWDRKSLTTVWMPTFKYWNTDLSKPLTWIAPPVWDNGAGYAILVDDAGKVVTRDLSVAPGSSIITIEKAGDGFVKIRFESGKFLGITTLNAENSGGTTIAIATDEGCKWKLDHFAQDRYKLRSEDGRSLSNNRAGGNLELVGNSFATTQIFRFL